MDSTPILAQMFPLSKALSNIQICSHCLHLKLYFHFKVLQLRPIFFLPLWPEFLRMFIHSLLPTTLQLSGSLWSRDHQPSPCLLSGHFFHLSFDLISQPLLHYEPWACFSNLLFLWEPHCHLSCLFPISLAVHPVSLRCPWNSAHPLNVVVNQVSVLCSPFSLSRDCLGASSLTCRPLISMCKWFPNHYLLPFSMFCALAFHSQPASGPSSLPGATNPLQDQPHWLLLRHFSQQIFQPFWTIHSSSSELLHSHCSLFQ